MDVEVHLEILDTGAERPTLGMAAEIHLEIKVETKATAVEVSQTKGIKEGSAVVAVEEEADK